MKTIFKSLFVIGAAVCVLAACSKDYLETAPESSVSPTTIFESTENAALAVNGLSKMMTSQYLSTQGMNGEGTIKVWYGNCMGNDFQRCYLTGWHSLWNWTSFTERNTSSYNYYVWFYYYKIIGNANQIIVNIDNAEGTDAERAFIKAQALTFRAYCFLMLSQFYGNRWCDSNNGATQGIVLRIDDSTGDIPVSTLAETYTQIYKDLDEAIKLFQSSGMDRSNFYETNIDVAYAVYARAALTREDWSNAAKYAALARKNYPLMSSKEYMDGGFSTPNGEWIWGVFEDSTQTLYYYSMYAYLASNASSSMQRTYPCAISRELYDQIPQADARRKMWLEPTDAERAELDAYGRSTGTLYKRAFAEYGSKLYSTSLVYQYMHFKFLATFMPGGGSFNIFRSAEMYLIEAEADCHLNKATDAQNLLKELNKAHNPNYSCSLTGDALLDEVKLYRRIDLWGEGFDWFDCKRWKKTIVRKSIKDGGSFSTGLAVTITPTQGNNWTWVIPAKETDYNDLIK